MLKKNRQGVVLCIPTPFLLATCFAWVASPGGTLAEWLASVPIASIAPVCFLGILPRPSGISERLQGIHGELPVAFLEILEQT